MTTPTSPSASNFLEDLRWRGLLNQCTNEQELAAHLVLSDDERAHGGRRAYVGFDPTADSLTIGNLVGIVALRRWQDAGHTPVVVMGGGTGLIGDPSGKSAERMLRTREDVEANVNAQRIIFDRVLRLDAKPNTPIIKNNVEWLGKLSYLDALRDIGKHFSVNMMIQKDSVKDRLNNRDQGISYTEFSYMILQAYDFAYLYEHQGVTMQMGGSDQFGNIVVGNDLIRRYYVERQIDEHHAQLKREGKVVGQVTEARFQREAEPKSFGLTWPLVTKSDGTKFGKTESGAIWLTAKRDERDTSPNRTSPYQFYQFWLNSGDADVVKFLKFFTLLPKAHIEELEKTHASDPGKREAHKALARHMTQMLHGDDELEKVEQATRALFAKPSSKDGLGGDDAPFVLPEDLLSSAPNTTHDKKLLDGAGMSLIDLLALTSLVKSKTEARTQLTQGAISVNGRSAALDARVSTHSLLPGDVIALKRGKKTWHITRWT